MRPFERAHIGPSLATYLEVCWVRRVPTPRTSHGRIEPRGEVVRERVHGLDGCFILRVSVDEKYEHIRSTVSALLTPQVRP